jgi:predicted HicB family RNase H-like nuclease
MIEHRRVPPPRKSTTRDKRVTVRLTAELHAAIVRAADRDRRSLASRITVTLENAIKAAEK